MNVACDGFEKSASGAIVHLPTGVLFPDSYSVAGTHI